MGSKGNFNDNRVIFIPDNIPTSDDVCSLRDAHHNCTLLNEIFIQCGYQELVFIRNSGATMGGLFGLLQMVIWIFWHPVEDVPLHATGPGSERLRGSMDNSELGRRIERIMGWDLHKLTAGLAPPAISQLDRDDPVTAGFSSWL